MAFVAFFDADVLVKATLRDVLLCLAEEGVYQPRWSMDVLDEMQRVIERLAKKKTATAEAAGSGAAYLRKVMEDAFPEAMVQREAYQALTTSMDLRDRNDRHVLAAAIVGRADVIVTFNTRHFPAQACQPYAIEVQDPDTFLVHQFGLYSGEITHILRRLAQQRHRPMDTVEAILRTLARDVPRFCAMARDELGGHD